MLTFYCFLFPLLMVKTWLLYTMDMEKAQKYHIIYPITSPPLNQPHGGAVEVTAMVFHHGYNHGFFKPPIS